MHHQKAEVVREGAVRQVRSKRGGKEPGVGKEGEASAGGDRGAQGREMSVELLRDGGMGELEAGKPFGGRVREGVPVDESIRIRVEAR